jgi:tRNA(Ile)-lysidine synthase
MEQKFLQYINHQHLFNKEHRLLLAVSGGIDSMVMLHLLHKHAFHITVAHCNFNLRGDESDGDASFVEEICSKLKTPCFIRHFNTSDFAYENGISIQMAARELRYSWFEELCQNHGFDFILTAHHADDQLETILLNLVRGKGPSSWSGIPVKNGKVVRPMLSLFKEEIHRYASDLKIDHRVDSSNLKADYDRNFIRHRITPLLKEINPSVVNTFSQISEMSAARELMIKDYIARVQASLKSEVNDTSNIDLVELKKLPAAAAVLFEIIQEKGFSFEQCQSIIEIEPSISGKQYLSQYYRAIVNRGQLLIKENTATTINAISFFIDQTQVQYRQGTIAIATKDKSSIDYKSLEDNEACFDAEKLNSTLQIRAPQTGDSFMPLGMEHKKLISDFFIDKKMSIFEKEQTGLLVNDNEIIWVIGHRIDQRYRVTEETKKVLHLKWIPE